MSQKKKYELHPLGEAIFKIVKLVSSENKWTLIFAPSSKGYKSIPRTYTLLKEIDLISLDELGCNTSDPSKIKKKLQSFVGKTVIAKVGKARNEAFRNIEGFVILNNETFLKTNANAYINSTT